MSYHEPLRGCENRGDVPRRLARLERSANLEAAGREPVGRGWTGVAEFLAMGGYAGYVWSAFGFTFVVMIGLLVQSWRLARRRERELSELRARLRPGREPAAAHPLVARRPTAAAELHEGA